MSADLWWLLAALVVVIAFGAHKGLRPILATLDARADQVRDSLHEAESLRMQAEKNLAESLHKRREAMKEGEAILVQAKEDAENARQAAAVALAAELERGRRLAESRLASAEAELERAVRARIAGLALDAATSLLAADVLDAETHARLVDEARKEAAERL